MSAYLGDFRTGKTIYSMWNSNAIAGGSITRATNGTISVYKDSSNTQSTTGVTDTEDKDSLTGVHYVAIDTSADGTFYSAGSDFMVVLSAATIDGKTINAFLFQFSLENRSHLMPTTDGRKLDVSAGGEAGVDWANVAGAPTTTVNRLVRHDGKDGNGCRDGHGRYSVATAGGAGFGTHRRQCRRDGCQCETPQLLPQTDNGLGGGRPTRRAALRGRETPARPAPHAGAGDPAEGGGSGRARAAAPGGRVPPRPGRGGGGGGGVLCRFDERHDRIELLRRRCSHH